MKIPHIGDTLSRDKRDQVFCKFEELKKDYVIKCEVFVCKLMGSPPTGLVN